MATSPVSEILQHLQRTVLLREGTGLPDAQLLGDYLSHRDEAALAALVRRHGPMVWGVCRRILSSHHDAEDAFQATFLVLVRKAASIASRGLLANWLYGVAQQTALKARATAARRKERERQVTEMPEPAVEEHDLSHDLQPLLDQELSSLPDKYRVVIVLCDLEGKTRKEAARQLGCPEGTVAGRLVRARVMLARRLARHGLAVSSGALAAVLAQNVASAGVPASLVSSTIRAAGLFAAGKPAATGVISAKVAALTEGVLRTMLLTKLKIAAAVLLVILAGVGSGTVAFLPVVAGRQPTVAEKQEGKEAAKKAEDAFPGEWTLAQGQTGGLTRIVITKTKDGWSIQAWASVEDRTKEKDQGKTVLTLLRDYESKGDTDEEKTMNKYGFATWDQKFADRHLTLRLEKDRLIAEDYTIFKDKSDRPHYRSRYEFKKKN